MDRYRGTKRSGRQEEKRGLRKICASSPFFEGLRGGFEGFRKRITRRSSGTCFFCLESPLLHVIG
jgi:hypothetical protein